MANSSVADKLCSASARGDLNGVQLLLQDGTNVNGFNRFLRTALQVVMLGSTAVVRALLEWGADPNLRDPDCGLTVTHDAAREGFVDTVRLLLEYGADANQVDNRGNLPLHLAAREGHLPVVQLLIGHTADPQSVNNQGYTAGQLARLYGRTDAAAFIDGHLNSD
ncbi:cyclin-dependent kinase 4 inhibitor C [Echeneis naucrates]|uniref:cyclin-dependent kinase 4 inhibitor C n=1 Tax=Echeneis naucrates TaxID=173247 RepID=UPI001113660C|nr:cyclin-dependent kinase 4 inhibitor C [Echeneis naucrates]